MILEGKNIILGVTGGIAAYKAVDLCSKLIQAGAHVEVIMTEAALAFLTPLTFQTLTQRPVSVDMFKLLDTTDMAHISLAKKADLIVIAPATANTIAKLANGVADNLLTTTVLASTAPLVLAPAMDADIGQPGHAGQPRRPCRARCGDRGTGGGQTGLGAHGPGASARSTDTCCGHTQTLGRRGTVGRSAVVVTGGRHARTPGSGAPPHKPLVGADGLRPGRSGARSRSTRYARHGPHRPGAGSGGGTNLGAYSGRDGRCGALQAYRNGHPGDVGCRGGLPPGSAGRAQDQKGGGQPGARTGAHAGHTGRCRRAAQRRAGRGWFGVRAETDDLLENAAEKAARKATRSAGANDVSATGCGFEVADNRVVLLAAVQSLTRCP